MCIKGKVGALGRALAEQREIEAVRLFRELHDLQIVSQTVTAARYGLSQA
jgi:hypothetical protein